MAPNNGNLEDTSPMKDPSGKTRPVPAPTVAEAEEAIHEAAKGNTNIDTLVGRLVIDQGLATQDEVQHCLEQANQLRTEANQASLVQILVDNEEPVEFDQVLMVIE